MMPYDQLCRSTIWREWSRPQGWIDGLQVNLEKRGSVMAAFSAARHESVGIIDAETRRRAQLLWPHLRRAVLIGKVIDFHKVEAAALADTLDGLVAGMILVDPRGRIAHANAAGRAMLSDAAVLCQVGDKLSAIDPIANAAIQDTLASLENGDRSLGTKGQAVPLASASGERYIAHILPLTSGARRKAKAAYSAVAALFVCKTEFDAPHPIDALATAFDLTPAELRVLTMIVQVGGVPEVAPILGVTEPTVKTHLQHIFEKTGTSRQADLVKLVARYMSPFNQMA